MPFDRCSRAYLLRMLLAAGCMLAPAMSLAQNQSDRRGALQGEVRNIPAGMELSIEFSVPGSGASPIRTEVSSAGRFKVEGLRLGGYQVTVVDPYRNVMYSTFVAVNGQDELTIRLPQQATEAPPAGRVSVAQLRQRIPLKARKEYDKGAAEYEKGNLEKAMASLEKAIEIDPSFADAYNELGACYAKLGQQDKAAAEFAKAAHLDPDSAMMQFNLALSLLKLNRLTDAEDAARAALRLDPQSAPAHFVLGYSLYAQKRFGQEVLDNLLWAGRQVPKALLFAADVLVRQGRKSEAEKELRLYLASPETGPDRQQAQSLLQQLGQ